MLPSVFFVALVALISSASVECGYASASSGSSSNSDGTGQTFTHTNNNGQQSSTSSQLPGGGFNNQFGLGAFPPQPAFPQNFPNNYGYYAPAGFNQFNAGYNPYGPAYPHNPFQQQYNQFPHFNGYNTPLQQYNPFPYQQPLATPQEFNKYLSSIQQQYAHGGVSTRTTPGATAFASSYLGPNKQNEYYKQQQAYLNSWNNPANAQTFSPGQGQGQGNYAYATGAYGPNGIHQTAGVNPPNKNKPNIDNRFGADETNPGGYFGVSTSSFSSSSNVNGEEQHKQGAVTSVNDNGKVTTYQV